MTGTLSSQIVRQIDQATQAYFRLVLVVGPARSGKTRVLRDLHAAHGWPMVNLNLALSERLLELTVKQRALRVARIVDDIVQDQSGGIVLVDNIEMLFHPDLQQDPLRLLQTVARNRTIVATWRGKYRGSSLTYAVPSHPEYRRIDEPQALFVCCGEVASGSGPMVTDGTDQEQSV